MVTDTHAMVEAFSDYNNGNGVFYGSMPRCYKQDILEQRVRTCVEAGLNTSTLALQVVGGDEKGTQCLGL
jgi:hypothetical protein